MARGDGTAYVKEAGISLPASLDTLITIYQRKTNKPSFSYTIQFLLETHPALVQLTHDLYNEMEAAPGGNRESG